MFNPGNLTEAATEKCYTVIFQRSEGIGLNKVADKAVTASCYLISALLDF